VGDSIIPLILQHVQYLEFILWSLPIRFTFACFEEPRGLLVLLRHFGGCGVLHENDILGRVYTALGGGEGCWYRRFPPWPGSWRAGRLDLLHRGASFFWICRSNICSPR